MRLQSCTVMPLLSVGTALCTRKKSSSADGENLPLRLCFRNHPSSSAPPPPSSVPTDAGTRLQQISVQGMREYSAAVGA